MDYSPAEASKELKNMGVELTDRSILRYIDKGKIKSTPLVNDKGIMTNRIDEKELRKFAKDRLNKQPRLNSVSDMSGIPTSNRGETKSAFNKTTTNVLEPLVEHLEQEIGETRKRNDELQRELIATYGKAGVWQGKAESYEKQLLLMSPTVPTGENITDIGDIKTDSPIQPQNISDNETTGIKLPFYKKNLTWDLVGLCLVSLAFVFTLNHYQIIKLW